MLFFIGLVIVAFSVIFGYTMHQGDLRLLWQPHEFLIIIGCGIGSVIISNPSYVLKDSIKALSYLIKGKPYTRHDYMDILLFFFNATRLMKMKGMLEIEKHLDNPSESEMFRSVPVIMNNPENLAFVVDNFRLITMGMDQPYQLEQSINKEIKAFEFYAYGPSKVFLTLGDALPALGIVAAVLGVILTMRSILEPPEVLGSMIAGALVGTFTGVLLSYGLCSPIGHFLAKYGDYKIKFYECIKIGMVSYSSGNPPSIIIENMRKVIPLSIRPSFGVVDTMINTQNTRI